MSAAETHKLTVAEAADQWEQAKLAMEGLKPLQKQAAEVLLDHFERTGRSVYKNRIVRKQTGGSLVLDQARVREFLGVKLPGFMKRTERGWTLELLG